MSELKILILSPFKTGTTTLTATFCNHNIDCMKLHDFDHTFHTDYSHVFLISRNNLELYASAFFQDIANPEFEYYFGTREQVLNADIDTLISHFKKFDWDKYNHLNIDYFIKIIELYFNINLNHDDKLIIKNDKYRLLKNNNTYFIFAKLENLTESFDEICKQSDLPEIKLEEHNFSSYKWYSEVYKKFLCKLIYSE